MTRQVECQQTDETGNTTTTADAACAFRHNKPLTEISCNKYIPCSDASVQGIKGESEKNAKNLISKTKTFWLITLWYLFFQTMRWFQFRTFESPYSFLQKVAHKQKT